MNEQTRQTRPAASYDESIASIVINDITPRKKLCRFSAKGCPYYKPGNSACETNAAEDYNGFEHPAGCYRQMLAKEESQRSDKPGFLMRVLGMEED